MPEFLTQRPGSLVASWKVTFLAEGTLQQRFEHRKHGLYYRGAVTNFGSLDCMVKIGGQEGQGQARYSEWEESQSLEGEWAHNWNKAIKWSSSSMTVLEGVYSKKYYTVRITIWLVTGWIGRGWSWQERRGFSSYVIGKMKSYCIPLSSDEEEPSYCL